MAPERRVHGAFRAAPLLFVAMRKNTLIALFVIVVVLLGLGVSLRGDGSRVTRWLASLHGNSGH